MWGLVWQRQDIYDQEYLLSFYVVCDEKPSAAPKLLIKSVIRTQCVQGGTGGRPAQSRGKKQP